MKTIILVLLLTGVLLFGCKGTVRAQERSDGRVSTVTSIEGMKNGKPIINYLGVKLEGC